MANYGELFLSKLIDSNDPKAALRLGVKRTDFPTEGERQAFDYIMKYDAQNGSAPSYVMFASECDGVTYIPDVTDSFEHLAGQLKEVSSKRDFAETVGSDELDEIYNSKPIVETIDFLTKKLERIRQNAQVGERVLTNIGSETERFLAEYRSRKAGTSFRIWYSKFPTINAQVGGYLSGNMYTWYARPGRGKSVVTMEEAIESAFQGATVLAWILEQSEYEWMSRAYTSISARLGLLNANINGQNYDAGFDNRAMLMGKLPEDYEDKLVEFLTEINAKIPGEIIVRATDSEGFINRGIAQLEADIIETKADVVVIDPIYLMDFEANTSRVAGGDVAETSKKLRRLAGRYKLVLHVITQADEDASEKGEDGVRELKPPKRAEIKKTKAVLEDAANVFGIDTLNHEGRGKIVLGKGRNGGEDSEVELIYLPNYGIVQEAEATVQAEQFAEVSGF